MTHKPNIGYNAKLTQGTYYRVTGDSDCEGRGPRTFVGCFLHEDTAKNAAQGQGGMGTMGYVTPVTGLIVTFEDSTGVQCMFAIGEKIELSYEHPEDVRKRALAKLTDREREVLGLSK